jgi:hypothetical protein
MRNPVDKCLEVFRDDAATIDRRSCDQLLCTVRDDLLSLMRKLDYL